MKNMKNICIIWATAGLLLTGYSAAKVKGGDGIINQTFPVKPQYLFKAGETMVEGVSDSKTRYGQFREPAIVQTKRGRLVLMTQAREHNGWPDRSGQDLVVRYSDDGGKKWSKVIMAAEHGNFSICPNGLVYDKITDRLHGLYTLYCWDYKIGSKGRKKLAEEGKLEKECKQYHIVSKDGGATWSSPREITEMLGNTQNKLAVFGSGRGIQLEHGPNKGRLCMPGGKRWNGWSNNVFYSDDHGKTWKVSENVPKTKGAGARNEAKVAECADGTLVINARSMPYRLSSISKDGGVTWQPWEIRKDLPTASCNAALISHKTKKKTYLVFSAPAGPARENGFVWVSEDGGKTWPHRRLMLPDTVAYTSMCSMKDGRIALVYENEVYHNGSYKHLKMIRFRIKDILGHKDELPKDRTDKNEGTYDNRSKEK